MKLTHATARSLLAGLLALSVASPALAADGDYYAEDFHNPDPWEPVNRVVFRFNDTLDTYALRPVARCDDRIMRRPLNDGISNVINILGEPKNLINNPLQGKLQDAGIARSRFRLSPTMGVVGIFDVATRMVLQRN